MTDFAGESCMNPETPWDRITELERRMSRYESQQSAIFEALTNLEPALQQIAHGSQLIVSALR